MQPMTDRDCPLRREDVEARSVRDEMVLYCPQTVSAYALNRSSRTIWEMCDGQHSVAEIVGELAATFRIDDELRAVVKDDVFRTLSDLCANGLLKADARSPTESA